MTNQQVQVIANKDHRRVVESFLEGRPHRVRIYAFAIRDVHLNTKRLGQHLIRLLASRRCTVTIAYGERLLKRDRQTAKDEASRQALQLLQTLEALGARVYYVPRPMLHAKVLYVEERIAKDQYSTRALVSSANFTKGGMRGGNYELGIALPQLESLPGVKNKIRDFSSGVLGKARSLEKEGA